MHGIPLLIIVVGPYPSPKGPAPLAHVPLSALQIHCCPWCRAGGGRNFTGPPRTGLVVHGETSMFLCEHCCMYPSNRPMHSIHTCPLAHYLRHPPILFTHTPPNVPFCLVTV